jgi:hypothetical protein
MNTILAVVLGGVMLVIVGRSLFAVINGASGLDARNRKLAILTVTLIMFALVATVMLVNYMRVG